jgi:hypothetical protein
MKPAGSPPFAASTTAARRSGPREHGRQAARSKRAGPAGRRGDNATQHAGAGAAGALIP